MTPHPPSCYTACIMPSALVSTDWVAQRLGTDGLRVIEVSSTRLNNFGSGHILGAVAIDWQRELIEKEDESSGLVISPERFAALARRLGLHPNDTLVFYGDVGGRHAARALWTFEYYRHRGPLHLMDGGREKWQADGRPMRAEFPLPQPSDYPVPTEPDETLRATLDTITARLGKNGYALVDTRTRDEYEGADVRAGRGGRIPGAAHICWDDAVAEDGTFKTKEQLAALYSGLSRKDTVVSYCQLGVRAAHTWFILRHVLGYSKVENYDGSWREWGDREDTPIEIERSRAET